ncbi:hypothetical protein FHR32_007292 [Streptosporangium album]|uniref:Uncharacterized protein n=1 Tax=Streptosporangium album TaxID=47479 RepID=A0A7W7S3N5_9ACTN|nr:hypothetical protein [Streptosporangium album]
MGHHAPATRLRRSPGRGGPLQFPPPLSVRSTPSTPGDPSRLHLQDLHRFHGLRPSQPGSASPRPTRHRVRDLTTRQASLHAADRTVARPQGTLDAGLRLRPFPDGAASLLPGSLTITRTGLAPASDDELTRSIVNHPFRSTTYPYWTHVRKILFLVVAVSWSNAKGPGGWSPLTRGRGPGKHRPDALHNLPRPATQRRTANGCSAVPQPRWLRVRALQPSGVEALSVRLL